MKINTFSAKPGQTILIVNQTNKSLKYILDYGEFGKVTYDLIIGATLEIEVGVKAPIITSDDSDNDNVLQIVK